LSTTVRKKRVMIFPYQIVWYTVIQMNGVLFRGT